MTPDPKSYPKTSVMVSLEIYCNIQRDYSHWSWDKSADRANRRRNRGNNPKKSNVELFKEFMAE